MIYSAAVTRFWPTPWRFGTHFCDVGEASTDVTPAKRPSEASNTTSQRKKARQPASKSISQRKKAKQQSPSTRTSPRLHPRKDAQKELAEPRVLLPTIAEDPPSPSIREPTSPSDSNISHDILAPTQETLTVVAETQLGGDPEEESSEDEALEDEASEKE
eukprot:g11874.t1 g11874   contig6:771833-772312(-)